MRFTLPLLLLALQGALAQFEPDNAHVRLYFPQFADGGDSRQTWQTSFNFSNPNENSAANCTVSFIGTSGNALSLDFGSGLQSRIQISIPARGRRTLRSRMNSRTTQTGWAFAGCDLPVQGTILFRSIQDGVPQAEISATAIQPSSLYRSIANRTTGVALVNVYDEPITLRLAAFDSGGSKIGTRDFVLCGFCHTSFNLSSYPRDFPREFDGTLEISSDHPANVFNAWTLNSERGLLSSLPVGGMKWPGGDYDRIWLVFLKLMATARAAFPGLDLSATRLEIIYDQTINANASADGTIRIHVALAQLLGDSQSELASIVGHEIAHIIQFRRGSNFVNPNRELDADTVGMLLSLGAGFDPYAGAGALGKLMMVSRRTDLFSQAFDNLTDPHTSFTNRMGEMFNMLQLACSTPEGRNFCSLYKQALHPNFPPLLPVTAPSEHLRITRPPMGASQ